MLKKVLIYMALLITLLVMYYISLPTLAINSIDGLFTIFFAIVVCLIVIGLTNYTKITNKKVINIGIGVCCLFPMLLILLSVISSPLFNAGAYAEQIGEIEEKPFNESILPVDNSQLPTVDIELAYKQGEKVLGQIPSLGSQVVIGEFTLQEVADNLIYVAPLEHTDILKYLTNQTTPGYITVSATDSSDVKLVQDLSGESINLKYLHSSSFGDYLLRHVKFNGYAFDLITDPSFELDDNGRPFYVITKYTNEIFLAAPEAIGTVICDVQTGQITEYSIEETPEWVDRIIPVDFVEAQIDNNGEYIHGIFNFSNKDKYMKTPGMIIVYSAGECYYYTGLTSVGSDESVIAFMMVNTRTKETVKFNMSGATETAAMSSAQGLVQDMGYYSTIPIPINLNSIPTYFMTLKDSEGLVKSYAMVNIENYSIAAVGTSIAEAKRNYISNVSSSGNNSSLNAESLTKTITGKVTRISSNIENGNTNYYMVLDNNLKNLYIAPYNISEELPVTRENDEVQITYMETDIGSISITSFDNLMLQ